jgi:elongation factor P
MISPGELKRGMAIELDNDLWSVQEWQHNKTGRGGAITRLKLRNLKSGANIERTFPASEKFKRVFLERAKAQYLYEEDGLYHFMDSDSFEQFALGTDLVGDDASYLKDGMEVEVARYQEQPISLELPVTVNLEVTDPGFKGDTATGGTKPAVVETGLRVSVPLFVNVGDVIKVDTRTGQYLERAG